MSVRRAARLSVLALVTAAALLAGCSGGSHPGTRPTPTAQTAAARAAGTAAQEAFDRYSSGDFAGAWETYTDEGRAAISQSDFVAFNTQCPPKFLHQKIKVVGVRLENSTTAVARYQVGQSLGSYILRYEGGHWRVQPSPEALATWKLGVDQAVAKEKAAGNC